MEKLPDLLPMIFSDFKTAGNINIGPYKLGSVHVDKFSSHISNWKQLHTHVRFYGEIVDHVDSAYVGSSFMGQDYAEAGL